MACNENGTQLRAAKPGGRVDRNQKKNQSSLAEQARASEKKRAGRRIHKIVLPRTKEKDFIPREHMFAGVVPKFIIKDGAAAEIMQERKDRKHNRDRDKDQKQYTKTHRAVESALQRGETSRADESVRLAEAPTCD